MQRKSQQLLSPSFLFLFMTAQIRFPLYASEVASHAMSLWLYHAAFETSNFQKEIQPFKGGDFLLNALRLNLTGDKGKYIFAKGTSARSA